MSAAEFMKMKEKSTDDEMNQFFEKLQFKKLNIMLRGRL